MAPIKVGLIGLSGAPLDEYEGTSVSYAMFILMGLLRMELLS